MHSDRGRQALLDMRDNIILAIRWTEGLSLVDFTHDRMRFYAVTRCLEIISEASRRLPAELRQRHDHMPWRDIGAADPAIRLTARTWPRKPVPRVRTRWRRLPWC